MKPCSVRIAAAWSAKVEEQRDTVSRALTYVELYGAYTACEAIYGVDNLLDAPAEPDTEAEPGA